MSNIKHLACVGIFLVGLFGYLASFVPDVLRYV